jgi:hypothetical protein
MLMMLLLLLLLLQVMLLSNITVTDQGCKDLLQLEKPGLEGLNM